MSTLQHELLMCLPEHWLRMPWAYFAFTLKGLLVKTLHRQRQKQQQKKTTFKTNIRNSNNEKIKNALVIQKKQQACTTKNSLVQITKIYIYLFDIPKITSRNKKMATGKTNFTKQKTFFSIKIIKNFKMKSRNSAKCWKSVEKTIRMLYKKNSLTLSYVKNIFVCFL